MVEAARHCRLYLTVPARPSAALERVLSQAFAEADIACVLLTCPAATAVPGWDAKLRELTLKRDIALLVESDIERARSLDADGLHISPDAALYRKARDEMGERAIIGVGCFDSRHDAMSMAELGADYVALRRCRQPRRDHRLVVGCFRRAVHRLGRRDPRRSPAMRRGWRRFRRAAALNPGSRERGNADRGHRQRLAPCEERRVRRLALALPALLYLGPGSQAEAAESPAYAAYAQGQYMTARKLAETEAEQGSKEAYTLLGEIYEEGLGVAQDTKKAADAYQKATDLGDADAQFSLGTFAAEGHGMPKDLKRAADLFEKAAQSGHAEAQYNLALIYLDGRGRPADETKAVEWMQKAASQGVPAAEYDLGGFYQFGRGVPASKIKAAEWVGKAAEAGSPEARAEFGVMLFKGEGIAPDEKRAAKMFRLAAEQGNPVAQNRLARLYANGAAVTADPVQAAKWHLLAREAGVSDFHLDLMLAKLTPEQRAAADKAVEDWRNGRLTE